MGSTPLRARHADLGTFALFVAPIGPDAYEAVVNRVLSNTESRRTPPRPSPPANLPGTRAGAAAGRSARW